MIPTVIVIGAFVRRWWVVVAGATLWPVAVVVWGDVDSLGGFLGASLIGAVNAAIGAVMGTAIWSVVLGIARGLQAKAHRLGSHR